MRSQRPVRHLHRGRKQRPLLPCLLGGLVGGICLLALLGMAARWGLVSVLAQEAAPQDSSLRVSVSLESSQDTGGEAPWYLRLVNPQTPLSPEFTVELTDVAGGRFDSRAAEALSQMLSQMEDEGLSPLVCSSFRTWEDQETLHQNEVDLWLSQGLTEEAAQEEASRWVVPAGTSEHETGLAADIVSSAYQVLEEEQEDTPEQRWLMEHCWEYGFILRYPKDKTDVTGVGYEPWHYRYVGVEAAQEMKESGQCLEEYWAARFTRNGS